MGCVHPRTPDLGHGNMAVEQGPRRKMGKLAKSEGGNIMYLTAGLLIPLIATIGAGVDLGQAYMAKSRLQQACDAGVLAGRKNMAEGSFDADARTAAVNMFNTNYPTGIYESSGITFTPSQRGVAEVTGSATATIRTVIMRIFGKETFDLTVNCTAKLEISNADVMFVLDTTGSMSTVNSGDTVSRIAALRTEVMAFYDTLQAASAGDARIRYGFVPYSLTVNVRDVLEPGWVTTSQTIPSRSGQWVQTSSSGPTTNNPSWSGYSSWSNTGVVVNGATSGNCSSQPTPTPNPQVTNGAPTAGGGTSGTSPRTVTTTSTVRQTETSFQNVWSSSACRQQRRTRTRDVVTTSSVTEEWRYTYRDITVDTTALAAGEAVSLPSGVRGADVTETWNGCIMERDTVAFDDAVAPPPGTFDLDIDLTPTNDATRWRMMLPAWVHARASNVNTSPQTRPTLTTTTDFASYETRGGDGDACPAPASRLRAYPAADRGLMQAYVNSLQPRGFTYHDAGMAWGARLISPTGMYAADNATAPNGSPISRHILFMTDGEMNPEPGAYSLQGMEILMNRVGSNNDAELTRRHNARFIHLCNEAKARNITVWVVAFGTALNNEMRACASGDKAYQANNAAQLRTQFQAIAQQITRLRLSE